MNNVNKVVLTLAVMTALFNGGNVNAAENSPSEEEIQIFNGTQTEKGDKISKQIKSLEKRVEELSKFKKSSTKKEIEEINEQIAELNRQINEQRATQQKMIDLVERLEKMESQRGCD